MRHLHRAAFVPAPIEDVWAFFSNPENLGKLTPEKFRFELLTPTPVEMKEGATIDYRLHVFGVPIRWTSRITLWEPPHRFADEQLRGPYSVWNHVHRFEEAEGGTNVIDEIDYLAKGWIFEPIIYPLVRRDMESLFEYRRKKVEEIFGATGD